MSATRSASELAFINALSQANNLARQGDVRLPFVFGEYKTALELYQQISVDGPSEVLLGYYSECRIKFLRYSTALIDDLIKPEAATDVKERLINHAETVLDLREKFLTASDDSENRNQANFRVKILHLKQDLEIVKVAGYWGFNCIDMPKDGNCLFYAIADQLKLNDLVIVNPLHNKPHHALRSLAVQHLRVNKECYAVHIPNDMTLSSYTARLDHSGTWGDHLEIMALVRELMITLVLVQDDRNIIVFKTEHPKAIFYLGYETNFHFVSLHKQDNSPLHRELESKIENAPIVEMGPYISHAVLEKKIEASTVSDSESRKILPNTVEKKQGSTILALFFKPSSSTKPAEDKSKQQKPNKLINFITKGSSSSLGRK